MSSVVNKNPNTNSKRELVSKHCIKLNLKLMDIYLKINMKR